MNKKLFYLIGVAIAVLIGASSCEKDMYQKSDIGETYFTIVDETHINTYDQQGIMVEKNREVSFEIKTQYDLPLLADTLMAGEEETLVRHLGYGSYSDDAVSDEDASLLVTFNYKYLDNKLRVYGVLQRQTKVTNNQDGDDDFLLCLDDIILTATILPFNTEEENIRVLYELKCKNIVLTSATQIFNVYNTY